MTHPIPPKTLALVREVVPIVVSREMKESTVHLLTIPEALSYLGRCCLVLLEPHSYWARATSKVPSHELHDAVRDAVREAFVKECAARMPEVCP